MSKVERCLHDKHLLLFVSDGAGGIVSQTHYDELLPGGQEAAWIWGVDPGTSARCVDGVTASV